MGVFNNLVGETYGRLTVIKRVGTKYRSPLWECICSCGNTMFTVTTHLKSGNTFSCGCSRLNNKFRYRHGQAGSKNNGNRPSSEYKAWTGLIKRCTNHKDKKYNIYGGRGISVCDRWLYSFENFYADMKAKPDKQYSLDRIDVNGNYEPNNCRWATLQEQAKNKRNNVFYEHDGVRQTIGDWARELHTYPSNINRFFKRGHSFVDVYNYYKYGIKVKKK